jgi:Cdc6-like AAA superfamily ATPase
MGFHEKMLLLAIARFFKENKETHVTLTEIEESYNVLCEEYEEAPFSHTQLWKYLQRFTQIGLIRTEIGNMDNSRGRTTMISLPAIPAAELEHELYTLLKEEYRWHGD